MNRYYMQNLACALITSTVLLLQGCGGGGDDTTGGGGVDALCDSMVSVNPTVRFTASSACGTCASSSEAQSIDGNFDTKGSATFPNISGGTIELRATAQSGVVFPAGSSAGVVYGLTGTNQVAMTLSIVTYLAGAQQQTYQIFTSGSGGGDGSKKKTVFTSTMPYDAVALSYNRASGSAASLDAYEFCSKR